MIQQTFFGAALIVAASAGQAEERIQVTGEVMDTWCYFSGVMGGADAVVGSSHHTCALWCAAGGIPVGILADDGTVYMVLKLEGSAPPEGPPTVLSIQSHRITADGVFYRRDGMNYLVVEDVAADEGIVNLTHEIYGTIPGFVIPELN